MPARKSGDATLYHIMQVKPNSPWDGFDRHRAVAPVEVSAEFLIYIVVQGY
jgi:hypothetical protein